MLLVLCKLALCARLHLLLAERFLSVLVSNEQLIALSARGGGDDAEVSIEHAEVGHGLCESLSGLGYNFVAELAELDLVTIRVAKDSVFDTLSVLCAIHVARRLDLH